MPAARSGLVSLAYIQANFRLATVEDFVVGLRFAQIRKENSGYDASYSILGRRVTSQLIAQAIDFQTMILNGEAYVVTYYAGGPIGGGV